MSDGSTKIRTMLESWRERGDDRLDPMRFHLIEALERRAAQHGGETRRLLDEKLSRLIEAYTVDLEHAASEAFDAADEVTATASANNLLAALNTYVANRHASVAAVDDDVTRRPTYPELEMLDYFREVWSKVRTQKQLRQSFEQVPGNAGPLNSSSLVHRSLSLMRELSPGYLQQFLSYVETLSWMEQLNSNGAPQEKDAPRAAGGSESRKKSTRSKSR